MQVSLFVLFTLHHSDGPVSVSYYLYIAFYRFGLSNMYVSKGICFWYIKLLNFSIFLLLSPCIPQYFYRQLET
jgi:hypothetical protein